MIIRSIRFTRSVALGGGDTVRYSAAADVGADENADAAADLLALAVNGWLHDRLTAHYAGEDVSPTGGRRGGRGADQT